MVAIAKVLNDRGIWTARGGRWLALLVRPKRHRTRDDPLIGGKYCASLGFSQIVASDSRCVLDDTSLDGAPRHQVTGVGDSKRSAQLPAPGTLVLLLVIVKSSDQAAQDFRRGFEHRLQLKIVDLVDILAQGFPKTRLTGRHG